MSIQAGATALPPPKIVRDMLLDLLGRDVTVAPSDPWAPTVREPGAVAVYVNDRTRLRAIIACDLELSVAFSASIALIPSRVAKECVEEGQMTADMAENLNEVLNILAALFNSKNGPHVKLFALYVPGDPPPADLSGQLRAFGTRQDLKIDVAGYGGGRFSLVVV